MKKTASLMYLASCVAVFAACDNEDRVKEVSKEGAVETFIQIDHLNDSLDIMKTTSKVWVHGGLAKTIERFDTLPSLGNTMEEAENEDGEIRNVALQKDYELYLTIK